MLAECGLKSRTSSSILKKCHSGYVAKAHGVLLLVVYWTKIERRASQSETVYEFLQSYECFSDLVPRFYLLCLPPTAMEATARQLGNEVDVSGHIELCSNLVEEEFKEVKIGCPTKSCQQTSDSTTNRLVHLKGLGFFSGDDSEEICHLRRRSHLLLDELERERQGNSQLRLELSR